MTLTLMEMNWLYSTTLSVYPLKGAVVFYTDGTFIYTPFAGAKGTDQFVYRACDNNTTLNLCTEASVYITFYNDPPVAGNDNFETEFEVPITGDLAANDSDPNNDNLVYNTTPVVNCTNGTVVINSDGTFTYTPNADFYGSDSFTYRVCDDGSPSRCSEAQANITINEPINHYPVAVNDINNTLANIPVSGNVLTNDYDIDGDQLVVISSPYADPSNGTVELKNDGSYTYTPNTDFEGEDFFMYVICEVGTDPILCDTAMVTN